jgi:hypothetical protein
VPEEIEQLIEELKPLRQPNHEYLMVEKKGFTDDNSDWIQPGLLGAAEPSEQSPSIEKRDLPTSSSARVEERQEFANWVLENKGVEFPS